MRIVIEMEEGERVALKAYCASLNIPYSQLFRILLKLSLDGSIPRDKLELEAKAPRPVFNVSIPQADTSRPKLTLKEREALAIRKVSTNRKFEGLLVLDTPVYKDEVAAFMELKEPGGEPTPPAPEPKKRGKK